MDCFGVVVKPVNNEIQSMPTKAKHAEPMWFPQWSDRFAESELDELALVRLVRTISTGDALPDSQTRLEKAPQVTIGVLLCDEATVVGAVIKFHASPLAPIAAALVFVPEPKLRNRSVARTLSPCIRNTVNVSRSAPA